MVIRENAIIKMYLRESSRHSFARAVQHEGAPGDDHMLTPNFTRI